MTALAGEGRSSRVGLAAPAPDEAWECPACGWSVWQAHLMEGVFLPQVRDAHLDLYCARPALWPQR